MCEPDTAGTHLLERPVLCKSSKHTCSEDGLAESYQNVPGWLQRHVLLLAADG